MTTRSLDKGQAIAAALMCWVAAGSVRAEPPDGADSEGPTASAEALGPTASVDAPGCPCAAAVPASEAEGQSETEPFEPSFILSLAAIPRVDGWNDTHGHRSGWGMAAGVDLSPWEAATEVHIEFTYLTNRDDSLFSGDLGLKVPFHSGHQWDVHGVVGPSVAFDWETETLDNGEKETRRHFVVGVIGGLGVAYWFHRNLGATLDLNYRVIGGEGIQHRLFTSMGMAARW